MFEISTLANLHLKYKSLFDRLLYGFTLKSVKSNGKITFINEFGEKLNLILGNENIIADKELNDGTHSYEMITLPNDINHCIYSIETRSKLLENEGKAKVEEIVRVYDKTEYSEDDFFVTYLENNVSIGDNFRYVDDACSRFVAYMSRENSGPNNAGNVSVHLNGRNVSDTFSNINGPYSVEQVYNLYNGIINPNMYSVLNCIGLGLFKEDTYCFKEVSKVKEKEEKYFNGSTDMTSKKYLSDYLVDELGYTGNIDLNNRKQVLEIINKFNKSNKRMNDLFEETYNISLSDFINLDSNEQLRILNSCELSDNVVIDTDDCIILDFKGTIIPFDKNMPKKSVSNGYVKKD